MQWWSAWYPGAEPGGGGYIAQRMLAAKNEKEAMKATLWFNIAHYGLRPWPWIIVALCSMVVYPELADIQARFPDLNPSLIGNDLAYPAMLVFLPAGLLGLVVASLAAAYMSTISTQLNWGSSYVVSDFYRRFVNPGASDRQLVAMARMFDGRPDGARRVHCACSSTRQDRGSRSCCRSGPARGSSFYCAGSGTG